MADVGQGDMADGGARSYGVVPVGGHVDEHVEAVVVHAGDCHQTGGVHVAHPQKDVSHKPRPRSVQEARSVRTSSGESDRPATRSAKRSHAVAHISPWSALAMPSLSYMTSRKRSWLRAHDSI